METKKTWKVLIIFHVAACEGGLAFTKQRNGLMHQAKSNARKKKLI